MGKPNKIQVIVHCLEYEKRLQTVENLGHIKYKLPMIDAYVIEVEETQLEIIKSMDGLISVEMDTHITAQMNRVGEIIESKWAHEHGYLGKNIGVAIVDTGITLHKDFVEGESSRVIAFEDFINQQKEPYDDNGHGTHVAGIIGGSGYSSKGKYVGVAPACNFIGVKVLDNRGDGNISDVLAGLQWIIDNRKQYNIRIVNISVGTSSKDNLDENSLLVQGVNAVWDSGIIVVVAAGNNGPGPMSISTPGISRKVITVGSSDDNVAVEVFGNRTKDYSGRGPTPYCIKKPDIVAPGSNIISCNISRFVAHSRNSGLLYNSNDSPMMYTIKSGTSMATPVVSGAIALLLSAHPELSNREVKLKLRNSAVDLGQHWEKQGWGLLNVRKLLE